jgi:tetratricopeptide (TPR) repeat protein
MSCDLPGFLRTKCYTCPCGLRPVKKTTRPVIIPILLLLTSPLYGASTARTVLVFPFANQSNRTDLSWISEGIASILSARLAAPERYVLGREERDAAYAQIELAPGTPLTLASDYKVAETLGVDWAVVGSFDVVGHRLTSRAQLLDARGLKLSLPIEATGELTDLVDLQTQMAWRMLAAHDSDFVVGQMDEFRRRFPEIRLDAFENYIRGILATDEASRVRFLMEADKRDPLTHQAAYQLGLYYYDQKDYAKSVPWMQKLDERDPNYLEAQFLLGVSEYFLGHDGAAEKAFAGLARQIPLNEVTNNLGLMEARRHDYPDALVQFQRAYQADPSDPDFAFNLGVCMWYLKRLPEASKYLKEAVSKDEEDVGAHTLLGLVSQKLGDSSGQQAELKWLTDHEGVTVTRIAEEDVQPQARIKKHYDGRAFRLLALAVHNAEEESLARKSPAEHAAAHLSNGRILLAEGRLAESERELEEAVSLVPENDQAHLNLAEVLEAEGKHQDSRAEVETALKLNDTSAGHLLLARVYLSLNRMDVALAQSKTALSLDPNNREAAQLIGQIQAQTPPGRKSP